MSQESTSFSVHAFAESQHGVQLVNSLPTDARLGNADFLIKMGGIAAANETYAKIPTPNILILETSQNKDVLLQQLDSLAENCDPETKVFLLVAKEDLAFQDELLEMGITAVFNITEPASAIITSLLTIIPEKKVSSVNNGVISILSSRPGAGGSTIAHNLAWALGVERNEPTILIDFDIAYGTVGLNYFRDPIETVETALNEAERGAVNGRYLKGLAINIENNLDIITSPANIYLNNQRSPNKFAEIANALSEEYKNVIIDLPAEWSPLVKHIAINSSQVLVVGSPDLSSLRNSKNIVTYLKKNKSVEQIQHIILNRVNEAKRKEIKLDDFEDSLEIPVLASIPYDSASTSHMELNGQMPLEKNNTSQFSKHVRNLANFVASGQRMQFETEEEDLVQKSPILSMIKKIANG